MVPLETSPLRASLIFAVRSATPEVAVLATLSAAEAMPGTATARPPAPRPPTSATLMICLRIASSREDPEHFVSGLQSPSAARLGRPWAEPGDVLSNQLS